MRDEVDVLEITGFNGGVRLCWCELEENGEEGEGMCEGGDVGGGDVRFHLFDDGADDIVWNGAESARIIRKKPCICEN